MFSASDFSLTLHCLPQHIDSLISHSHGLVSLYSFFSNFVLVVLFCFVFFFQERGVGAFPPNFVVTTMMDVAAVRAHDKNPIMCSSCEDKLPAAARCIECMDFLCHDCRNAHMRLRLTKTHRVNANVFKKIENSFNFV